MRIIKVFIFLFSLIFFNLYAVFSYSNSHFILDNGLEVFFIPDRINPISNIKISVKAGTSSQTETNSGFYELYTKIFWTMNEAFKTQTETFNYYKSLGACNIEQNCLTDESYYSMSFPAAAFNQIIKTFSEHFTKPEIQEKQLSQEFSKLKKEAQEISQSASGFINTVIAKALYGKNYSHHNSLDYTGILKCKNTARARAIISEITKGKYVPNNCAIFLSGPYNETEILSVIEQYFSSWNTAPETVFVKDKLEESKKYVIVSPDFSKDISQCVIHYPVKSTTENTLNDTFLTASILENQNFSFKQSITNDKNTGITDSDYINISSSENGNYPALILQALCKITDDSPVNQTEKIISILNQTEIKDINELQYAYETFYINRKSQNTNSTEYISYISNQWIYPFFSDTVSTDLELKNFFCEKPFVFILVHPDNYKKNKNDFIKKNYIKVTPTDINNPVIFNTDNKNEIISGENETFNIVSELKNGIFKTQLSNSIPVFLSTNTDSSNAIINFELKCGELEFKKKEKGMATLITAAFVQNIINQINSTGLLSLITRTKISYQTFLTKSLIKIECLNDDLFDCISCISKALIISDITHAQADELINQIKYKWRLDNNNQDFQLNMIALNTLYSGTELEEYFSLYTDILPDLNFNKLRSSYARLLDSEKIKINIYSNIQNTEKLISLLEEKFGMLKKIEKINTVLPYAEFSNITLKKKLQRIFTTDIPADKAPKRPLHLIPTAEFFDNAHIYFYSPDYNSNNSIVFQALIYFIVSKLNEAGFESKGIFPHENMNWACISFEKVKGIDEIKNNFSKVISGLNESVNDNTLQQIRQICITSHFNGIQNNSGIQEKDILDYEQLENAGLSDYKECISNYFTKSTLLYVFSSDTPQKAKKK